MYNSYSYWEQNTFFKGYDALIIGSGIVGLNAALHLKSTQPKLKVAVLEAGFLPTGASTKNAGFACFGSLSEIFDDMEQSTEEEVLQIIELRWCGLNRLKKTLGEKAIDFQKLGGYEIFNDHEKLISDSCIERIPYINKMLADIIGQPDIYAVVNDKIAGFGFKQINSMILNRCEAQIDSGKMMAALLSKVASIGVSVFNNCKVLDIQNQSEKILLTTTQGLFETKKVIVATNAFIRDFFPSLDVVPGRGQVLMTEQIPGLKVRGTFHYDKGYYYFRNIDNRILLGGGRNLNFKAEESLEFQITNQVQQALEKLLYQTIAPDYKPKIEYRWSGVMAFGKQPKPIIKKLKPNIFCAVRCNGMGIAMGSLTGEQVAELVLIDF